MTMEQFLDYREREAESPTTASKAAAPSEANRPHSEAEPRLQPTPKRFPSKAFGSRSRAQSPPPRATSTTSRGTSAAEPAVPPPDSDPPQGTLTAEEVPETPAPGEVQAHIQCQQAIRPIFLLAR